MILVRNFIHTYRCLAKSWQNCETAGGVNEDWAHANLRDLQSEE